MFFRCLPQILLTVIVLSGFAVADDNVSLNREYQLKTVYLFHFAELAQWPQDGDIAICLLGASPLSPYLPALEGRQIASHVVHVKAYESAGREPCQIVFLSDNQLMTPALTEQAKAEHILLVGDGEDFAHNGGMLQFTLRDNKLKLLINLSVVKAAGLKLSSKLLRMAEILE